MKSKPGNNAFTLLEILAALAIMMIVISIVYGTFKAASHSAQQGKTIISDIRQGQSLLEKMTRQIRCAYADSIPIETEPHSAGDEIQQQSPVFFYANNRAPDDVVLKFITTAPLFNDPELPRGLFKVAYRYQKDKEGGSLYYAQQPCFELSEDNPRQDTWHPLAQNIYALQLSFFDENNWHDTWPDKNQRLLPHAVKISLELGPDNTTTRTYNTIVTTNCYHNPHEN
ncbi:MAG: prepilin-type N-terminal cleavage/methylation domain-containing protein [Sedimentisphaerales bacterium]|nr:prepilin-type N-terminal cleavage/methylation domain-containing protein [Sedimentisphaerales bacterium]